MTEAVFYYTLLLLTMVGFASITVQTSGHEGNVKALSLLNFWVLVPAAFFVFIIGFRYDVGVDYPNYINALSERVNSYHSYESILQDFGLFSETGAELIYFFVNVSSSDFSILFIIYAILQIYFFYKAFDKKILFLLPYAVFFIICLYLGSVVNIMRQFLSLMILFTMIKYIEEKNPLRYWLLFIIALAFHKSMVICLPLYFFIKKDIFKTLYLQLIILGIVIVLKVGFYNAIFNIFTQIGALVGYVWYFENETGFDVVETDSGLGFAFDLMLDFVLVFFCRRLKDVYSEKRFVIYYNLFFIGLLLKIFFLNIFIFGRTYVYFYSFRFIILAFLCHYLLKNRNLLMRISGFGLIIIELVLFFFTLEQQDLAPYQFIWDK